MGGGEVRRGALAALLVWLALSAGKWLLSGGGEGATAASRGPFSLSGREASARLSAGVRPLPLDSGEPRLLACIRNAELVHSVQECERGCTAMRCSECACRGCDLCVAKRQPMQSAVQRLPAPAMRAARLGNHSFSDGDEDSVNVTADDTELPGGEAWGLSALHKGRASRTQSERAATDGNRPSSIGGHDLGEVSDVLVVGAYPRNATAGDLNRAERPSAAAASSRMAEQARRRHGLSIATDSDATSEVQSTVVSGAPNATMPREDGGGLALGVLTQSRSMPRWKALEETWIAQFPQVLVVESHVDVSRVQQIWKYVPQRLYSRFPNADWYLIIDDDVFINADLVRAFIASRDPTELALYGPGFCEWGVPFKVMARAGELLGVTQMPPAVHIVIGGIMLFTAAAVKKFTDAQNVLRCIDDLETLYANGIKLWGGLKESALYNQDWLFCWCLQVRLGGSVVIGDFNAFEDIDFPQNKCLTVADAARTHVGVHHVNPRRMRALWRAYLRTNGTISRDWSDEPARRCSVDARGNPVEVHQMSDYRYLDSFAKPPRATRCRSIVSNKDEQEAYPGCVPHMAKLKQRPYTSACYGGLGHARCAGFQLDINDNCNLQYALYCDGLFTSGGKQWCPSPKNYPEHCCYARALEETQTTGKGGRNHRVVRPQQHLLQVFPGDPVFMDKATGVKGKGKGKGKGSGAGRAGDKGQARAVGRRLFSFTSTHSMAAKVRALTKQEPSLSEAHDERTASALIGEYESRWRWQLMVNASRPIT